MELAEKHFYFTPDERMQVFVEDGRAFLRRNPEQQWDAIILDAFTIGGRLLTDDYAPVDTLVFEVAVVEE